MQFDRAKLKAAILHVCSQCEPAELGAVKLHKTLYYGDMIRYLDAGVPITGSTYRKRPFGPTCDALLSTLRELQEEGAIRVREVKYFGYRKKDYLALRGPESDRLSEAERAVLDESVDFVCRRNTARTISDFSHSTPWEIVEFGEVLPYHNALHLIPNEVSEEALDWALAQAPAIEAERSKANPLDYPVFAAIRGGVRQAGRS